MFQQYKSEIKLGLFAVLVLAVVYGVYQYGQSVRDPYGQRMFTVEGKAKVETPHDTGTFTATVHTEGDTNTKALQSQNSEKMNAVISYLKDQGIDEKDLKTDDYTLLPRYANQECRPGQACPPSAISGYTIEQSVEITVRDVSKAGDLLSGVVNAGANTVTQLQFSVADDSEARDAARAEALKDAEKRAETLARAGGFHVGKLVTFYETGQDMGQSYPMAAGAQGLEAKNAPTIEPGTEKDEVRMTVTYEIR